MRFDEKPVINDGGDSLFLATKVNIAMATSDLYSHLAFVTLKSLFINNVSIDEIVVFFIGDNLEEQSKTDLINLVQAYQREIVFIDLPEEYSNYIGSNRNGKTVFSYCFLQELLPSSVDRVLLLEPDQIITGSIASLYATDLSGYYIAATDDLQSALYKSKIGMSGDSPYVNCGVILFNLAKWREDNLTEIMKGVLKSGKNMFFYDVQDVINYVTEGKAKVFPPRFNATTAIFVFDYKDMIRYRHPSTKCVRAEYDDAREHPTIVHFTKNQIIQPRPWVRGCQHPYQDYYNELRKGTPMDMEEPWNYKKGVLNNVAGLMYAKLPTRITASLLGIVHAYLYPALLYKFIFRDR